MDIHPQGPQGGEHEEGGRAVGREQAPVEAAREKGEKVMVFRDA